MKFVIQTLVAALFVFLASAAAAAQAAPKAAATPKPDEYKATAAYAELRLKKAELEAELESLLVEYTDAFPKVKEIRTSLGLIQKESDRLQGAAGRDPSRLTLALGRLMVRKVELEADLIKLLENLQPAHPDAKRASRKVEIFEAAIRDILGK